MVYVALLRGINVGGKNIIKMTELKKSFESCGYENVKTLINSGNVIFESKDKENAIEIKLVKALSKEFKYDSTLTLRSLKELQKIVNDAPLSWKRKNKLRCYLAFVFKKLKVKDIIKEIDIKEGIDSLDTGKDVLYMTTKLSGLTKSSFTKLTTKKFYKELTIRNFTTVKKLLDLMEIY